MKTITKILISLSIFILIITSIVLNEYGFFDRYYNNDVELIDTTEKYFISDLDTSKISDVDSLLFDNEISKIKYHIIVGSFKDVENAKKLQYIYPNCKILPITENGFHRVSILEYNDLNDCIKKLKSFKENNGDAWILKQ